MSVRRILNEVKDCLASDFPLFSFDNSIYRYTTSIIGLMDTPYDDGVFALAIEFTEDYPFKPMRVRFLTPVHHPNISAEGYVSIDILREEWSASLTLEKVLLSITSLLDDPNYEDPLNLEVAELHRRNPQQCDEKTRQYTKRYAM